MKRKWSPIWIAIATLLLMAPVMFLMVKTTYQNEQKQRHTTVFLNVLEQALELYRSDYEVFPPPEAGGLALLGRKGKRHGVYYAFKEYHRDAAGRIVDYWNCPLVYRVHNELSGKQRVELYSVGANGKDEGGKGDDITLD